MEATLVPIAYFAVCGPHRRNIGHDPNTGALANAQRFRDSAHIAPRPNSFRCFWLCRMGSS